MLSHQVPPPRHSYSSDRRKSTVALMIYQVVPLKEAGQRHLAENILKLNLQILESVFSRIY